LTTASLFLTALSKTNTAVRCKILVGGALSSHKGINLPIQNFPPLPSP